MNTGVLMLFTGPLVSGPEGTWLRYVLNVSNGISALDPTAGTLEDVHRWLNEEFRVAPKQITDFNTQLASGTVGTQYYFDLISDDETAL